jgi:hypothetical protein
MKTSLSDHISIKKNSVLSITFILVKNAAFSEIKILLERIFLLLTEIKIFYLNEFSLKPTTN